MKSYLLVGGSGYIGRKLAERFHIKYPGIRIVVADIGACSAHVSDNRFLTVTCDATKELAPQIGKDHFDCIFNLAAVHREPGHRPREYFDCNVLGARNVCAHATAIDCPQIVFTSSIAVYGPTEGPTTEQDATCPTSPYGVSKFMAELTHKEWQSSGAGRSLRIVRPGVVYGPGDPGNILRMIRAVRRGYFAFPGDPKTRKSFAYIEGLLDAMEFAAALPDPVFVFNYVEQETLPIADLVATVARLCRKRVPVIRVPVGALVLAAHVIQWATRGRSPIHPVRVRKACTPTWVVPRALTDRGFVFKYDFASSLEDWRTQAPKDFS